jgi:hypothetical protein
MNRLVGETKVADSRFDGSASEPAQTAVKKLRLRYAGMCVVCGAELAQGARALYDKASKTVRCLACPNVAAVAPSVAESSAVDAVAALVPDERTSIDFGTAGASAQREHDRRAAKREERVKERFGRRFGGLLLAVVDEPQSTRAWAQGALGERKLAEALAGVPDIVVLHDRKVPGTRGNIDHLVIAPGGLFVVDAKRYKGSLQIRDKGGLFRTEWRLYVGGRDCSHLAENMGWQVKAVETLLGSVGCPVAITPVLCFLEVEWPLLFATESFHGVRLASSRSLRKLVTRTQALDASEIDKLARILATGFPAK